MYKRQVVDVHGNIREQRSFNIVNGYDYQQKLKDREKSRDAARKNWEEIEKIKELKEGYLSMVIHYIAQLVVKYNAVVAMEDLNYEMCIRDSHTNDGAGR